MPNTIEATAPIVYMRDVQKRPRILDILERQRNRNRLSWLMEFVAEMVYFQCVMLLSIFSVVLRLLNPSFEVADIQVGLAVTFGIVFAVGVCGGTSAGHFNPSLTIAHCVFRGFPKLKTFKWVISRYLLAQILGGYIACMFVYYQYRFFIVQVQETLRTSRTLDQAMLCSGGPASMFAFYLPQGQSLGAAFLNEWVSSVFVGIVYWASIDPANSIVTPVVSPFVSALAYGIAIWGFGPTGVALNSAKDIGSHLWALTVWGLPDSGGRFAAISAPTNIPAMLFAALVYEMFLGDSRRVVTIEALNQMRVMSNRITESDSSVPYNREKGTKVEEVMKEMELWSS
ncbi:Putative aquaporin-7-like protein 3 [Leucoagaricus sp. SymC.cos]|nr:Putative aquaporin-7-like protein 3 [Leucoagaricus sp. SymC.cos]